MNQLFAAAVGVQQFCSARGWRNCYIGGLAVQRWGEPRQTSDGDLTLFTGFDRTKNTSTPSCKSILHDAQTRASSRWKDVSCSFRMLRELHSISRSPGCPSKSNVGSINSLELKSGDSLVTCSAEDLVIHKVFAGRGIDWVDVERILQRQRDELNFSLIFEELRPLLELKEEPENEERLRELMKREGLL